MAEVNEQIIEHYLKTVKNWFYINDISFKVPGNYSNIDILAFDPIQKKYYDIEVKYRSKFTFPNKDMQGKPKESKVLNNAIRQLTREERAVKIKEITGTKKCIKILVVTKHSFGSESKRKDLETKFKKAMKDKGFVSDIWYFEDKINELYDNIEKEGRHNNEFSQIIRMIKTYIRKDN